MAGSSRILVVLAITVLSLVNQAADLHTAAISGAATASADTGGQLGLLTQAVSGGGDVVRSVITGAQVAAQVGVIVILSVLIAFYFLADGGKLWAKALGRVRPDVAPEVDAAGSRAFNVLGGYMIGTGAISFVGAASQLVIMLVLGIPLALPVFVLSFFLCFIPYIGGFVSTGIALLITIAVGSPLDVGVMIVWTLVFNIVTGNIVTPLVYGRMVHLHPAVVLVAIPGGAAIAGMLGMFMVVPAMAVVASTWRTVLSVIGTHRKPVRLADDVARPAARAVVPEAPAPRRRPSRPEGDRPDPTIAVPPYGLTGTRVPDRLTATETFVMRASRLVIAILVALVGLVWIAQGTGIIGGGAMSGNAVLGHRRHRPARARRRHRGAGVAALDQSLRAPSGATPRRTSRSGHVAGIPRPSAQPFASSACSPRTASASRRGSRRRRRHGKMGR